MEQYEILEKELGQWADNSNMVVCSSGTSALQLAIEALGLPKGSKVIVPEFTMIACARAVTMAGLKPVFVDCGKDLLLDVTKLDEVYSSEVKAIMPVHVYGRRCNMNSIIDFAEKKSLMVIEDIAEGHGIKPHRKTNAACWSFYRNKIVAGEEGGAVAFQFRFQARVAKQLRSLGFDDSHNFLHHPGGFNCRLSNANAKLIQQSLNNVATNLHNRKTVCGWYDDAIPSEWKMPQRDVCWVYDLRIKGINQLDQPNTEWIVNKLNQQGIQARVGFKPMSQQPEYKQHYKHLEAYRQSKQIIYLPIYPDMSRQSVNFIVRSLLSLT